jgi:hypothetical protein
MSPRRENCKDLVKPPFRGWRDALNPLTAIGGTGGARFSNLLIADGFALKSKNLPEWR